MMRAGALPAERVLRDAARGRRSGPVVAALLLVALGALAQPLAAQAADAAAAIAADSAALREQIASTRSALTQASADMAAMQKAEADLDAGMQRIERRAKVPALGREFVQAVGDQSRQLPPASRFELQDKERWLVLASTSDAKLHTERALAALGDVAAAAAQQVAAARPDLQDQERAALAASLMPALAAQAELLRELDAQQRDLVLALEDGTVASQRLQQRSNAARDSLAQILFWVPARPGWQAVHDMGPSIAWTLAAGHWQAAARDLHGGVLAHPQLALAALLAALVLLAVRRRLIAAIEALSPARRGAAYRVEHTLLAMLAVGLLALPGPLLMLAAARLLEAAPTATAFSHALSAALGGVAGLLWMGSAFAWLQDRRGVGCQHFGWDAEACDGAARKVRRYAALFVPLMFVAALNGLDTAPLANRESLGRGAFVAAMLVMAGLFARLLRRRGALMRSVERRDPQASALRWHGLWFWPLAALPLAAAALAAAGYFVAAGYFYGRILASLLLVLAAIMLYGLMALWVEQQRSNLPPPPTAPDAGAPSAAPRVDVAALGEQTRSLLDLLVTALLLVGMWLVWKGAVPVLSVIGAHALWSYETTVGGHAAVHPVTVDRVMLALLIVVLAAVALRNAGALLDMLLLRRLRVQPDANYAVKTMTRYALLAIAVVAAAGVLGIGWGDVQWLVAALGVGLGFGLQEIVANFVCGLIVLVERPVRIGDVVTIGDVTGTVTRIRARATMVLDFDNKEVIIPNKAFITERVVNWTLSSQTTRIVAKVGVPHGSDAQAVQAVLLDALRRNADVLAKPPPSVQFVGFGDTALNFELRAFVDALDKRSRVLHEINVAVQRALADSKVEVPLSQPDVNLRSGPGPSAAGRP